MTGILCSLPMIGAPTADPPANPLAVSLNRTTVSGSASTSTVTTNSVTATGSGGDGGYTYSWARVSGNTGIQATNANSATTSFSRTGCTEGSSYSATWRCTVTDSSSNIVYSDNVSVTVTRTSSGGGGTDTGTFTSIDDTSVSQIGEGTMTATFTIFSNGTYTPAKTWNTSSTVGSAYEVKATVTSGSLTTGTTGSWLALSSNRSWAVTDTSSGPASVDATFTLAIRLVGETSNLDTATITLSANSIPAS